MAARILNIKAAERVKDPVISQNTAHKVVRSSRDAVLGVLTFIIIVGISYTILAPVIGIFSMSLMSRDDVFDPLVYLIPRSPSLANIRNAVQYMDYWIVLRRSLVFSSGMAVLHVIVGSLVGYGFARFRFWGKDLLFGLVILSIVVPSQAYLVPLFMTFRFFGPTEMNLIGNYTPMILLTATGVGIRSGLFIFIFRQFFRGMPTELSDASLIDGAGALRTFYLIMLPNAKPAIVTVSLFALVWHYGDVFYSDLLLRGTRFIHVALGGLMQQYMIGRGSDYMGATMVFFGGIILVVAPVMIIYVILQRQFIEGIERSGIVG